MEMATLPQAPRAIRQSPPLVGFALEHAPVVRQAVDATANFDARIMHREVPAELRNWTVRQDASDTLLSDRLGVAAKDIEASWLTSRSPLVDPRPPPTTCSSQRYRDLASNLRSRLESLLISEITPPRNTDKYYSHKPLKPLTSLSIDDDYSYNYNYNYKPSSLLSNSSSSSIPRHCCGFNSLGKCVKKAPSCDDSTSSVVIRTKGGLYSGAKHTRPIVRGETVYTEIEVLYAGGTGGIAVGVAEDDYSLDAMVGAKRQSMALHSEGKVVTNGKWSTDNTDKHALPYGTGDIVGLFVTHSKTGRIVMRTSVNGKFSGEINGESQGKKVYVMASMLRQGARVELRCCREEWRYSPFYTGCMGNPICAPRSCIEDKLIRSEKEQDDNTSAVLTP